MTYKDNALANGTLHRPCISPERVRLSARASHPNPLPKGAKVENYGRRAPLTRSREERVHMNTTSWRTEPNPSPLVHIHFVKRHPGPGNLAPGPPAPLHHLSTSENANSVLSPQTRITAAPFISLCHIPAIFLSSVLCRLAPVEAVY